MTMEAQPKRPIANWPRDHACVILAKNVAAFYPCPKNLLEAKFKSHELISVTEEISRQPKIDSAVWLLVNTPIYSEKEQMGQKETQDV